MKLKEIAAINAGYPFRGKPPEIPGSSIVVVQFRDISAAGQINWYECQETQPTGKRAPNYLCKDDILVSARGSNYQAYLVDTSLTETGRQALAAPYFYVIRGLNNDILPEFIAWLLNQNPIQHYLEKNAEGTLTKSIRRSVLENIPISIPNIHKQKAILAIAENLREERRLAQELVNNGERIMNALARDLYQLGE